MHTREKITKKKMTISVASLFPEQFQIHQIQNGAEIEPKSNANKSGNEFQPQREIQKWRHIETGTATKLRLNQMRPEIEFIKVTPAVKLGAPTEI